MINQLVYISEAFVSDKYGFSEATFDDGTRGLLLEGEFQNSNNRNKNGRRYTPELLNRETRKLVEIIESRGGHPMGMDHPIPDPNDPQAVQKIQRIDMLNACALNTQLEMANGVVYGKAKVLTGDNGSGDKLAAYVRHKYKPAVSSRGVGGKPIMNGMDLYVPEDYKMICYDFVTNPSTHNAILEQVYREQMEYIEQEIKTANMGSSSKGKSKFVDVLINFEKNIRLGKKI